MKKQGLKKKAVSEKKKPLGILLPLPERKKRAKYVQKELQKLYPRPEPPLHHTNPFTLLVAVLLSARNTDVGVNKATPALFKQADTPEKMVKLGTAEILKCVKTIGFAPTKSKNIFRLSELLIEKHQGQVPQTFEELEALPGVGHKTAGVVLSQAFGKSAFPVDTHVHRLAERWKLSIGKNVEKTEADLKEVFPEDQWRHVHLQMIFYGREFCTWNGCDGFTCPICKRLNT